MTYLLVAALALAVGALVMGRLAGNARALAQQQHLEDLGAAYSRGYGKGRSDAELEAEIGLRFGGNAGDDDVARSSTTIEETTA
jgi:NADPH-dependent 2,4-dienoyl-CoA reductase/sulfur reductase-like enzyme